MVRSSGLESNNSWFTFQPFIQAFITSDLEEVTQDFQPQYPHYKITVESSYRLWIRCELNEEIHIRLNTMTKTQ